MSFVGLIDSSITVGLILTLENREIALIAGTRQEKINNIPVTF